MLISPPFLRAPIPSPPASSKSFHMSSLSALLSLIALITIPTLIYAIFFTIRCPPCNIFRRHRRSSGILAGDMTALGSVRNMEFVSGSIMKFSKESHAGGECPVCLSVFADGEELRQLKACEHSFHVACIDKWLHSHSNCPVCRASIAIKRSSIPPSVINGEDDLRQGLPDSASLV